MLSAFVLNAAKRPAISISEADPSINRSNAASDSVVVRRTPSTTLPIRSTNRRSTSFSDTLVLLSSDTINRIKNPKHHSVFELIRWAWEKLDINPFGSTFLRWNPRKMYDYVSPSITTDPRSTAGSINQTVELFKGNSYQR